jgi:rare lipoprotein A
MISPFSGALKTLFRACMLLSCAVLAAGPVLARQADRETGRYVGSRPSADESFTIQWRADDVLAADLGRAGVYSDVPYGLRTASGERYDHSAMTAAHADWPFDSMVRVTRMDDGRRVVVRINDRTDPGSSNVIRLSDAAADRLGLTDAADAPAAIRIERLSGEPVPAVEFERRPRTARRRDGDAAPQAVAEAEPPVQADGVGRAEARRNDAPDAAGSRADDPGEASFTLQIGAFSNLSSARTLASDVDGAWVMQVMENGQPTYRVYYRQFESEPAARHAQKRLKERGRDSFLRTIPS